MNSHGTNGFDLVKLMCERLQQVRFPSTQHFFSSVCLCMDNSDDQFVRIFRNKNLKVQGLSYKYLDVGFRRISR